MNLVQSLVLGVTQGLTEFLPVSSTAHLILIPEVLTVARLRPEIAHTYAAVIQVGTVIPILIFFWRDWVRCLKAGWRMVRTRRIEEQDDRLMAGILLGSIPAGLLGLAFNSKIEALAQVEKNPFGFLVIGLALILVGFLMAAVEHVRRKGGRGVETVSIQDSLLVGLAQAAALIPGVSRSGATISAGMLLGLSREAAARFSFLLMTPIMLLATSYKLYKAVKGEHPLTGDEWQSLFLATAIAAGTGYLAIAGLLQWVRSRSLATFVWWRVAAGAFSIGLYIVQSRP